MIVVHSFTGGTCSLIVVNVVAVVEKEEEVVVVVAVELRLAGWVYVIGPFTRCLGVYSPARPLGLAALGSRVAAGFKALEFEGFGMTCTTEDRT